jgi:hypothetical protein
MHWPTCIGMHSKRAFKNQVICEEGQKGEFTAENAEDAEIQSAQAALRERAEGHSRVSKAAGGCLLLTGI